MKNFLKGRKIFHVAVLALMLLVAAPTSFSQDRGRRHYRTTTWSHEWNRRVNTWSYNRHHRNRRTNSWLYNRKCGKFVNCHDARNGRWDGRGPRGDSVSNIIRMRNRHDDNRLFVNNGRGHGRH